MLENCDGTNYDYSKVINGYDWLEKETGIVGLTSHVLRHTWISHLLNDCGVPVTAVQTLAGHSSSSTTLSYYSHASSKNLKDAMAFIS